MELSFGLGWPSLNASMAVFFIALTVGTASAPLAWTYTTGNYLWAVAVSRDGRYAVAGSDDMHAYFFEAQSLDGEPLWSHAAQGYVRDVAISRNGTRAAASDTDGNIFFFGRSHLSGDSAWSFRSGYPIEALSMNDDGGYLAAGDRGGNVYLFKTSLTEPLVWKSAIPGGVLALSLSESNVLAATSAGGGLYFFDVSSSGYVWSFQEYMTFPSLAIARGGSYVVAGGSDGYVYLIKRSGQLTDGQRLGGTISALSLSDTVRFAIAASTNGKAGLFRIDDQLEEQSSLETGRPVTSTALSDDGRRISVASLDGAISVFDQSMTRQIWVFNAGAIVHSISMSGDGTIMAAGSDTGSVYLFSEKNTARENDSSSYYLITPVVIIGIVIGYAIWRKKNKP